MNHADFKVYNDFFRLCTESQSQVYLVVKTEAKVQEVSLHSAVDLLQNSVLPKKVLESKK